MSCISGQCISSRSVGGKSPESHVVQNIKFCAKYRGFSINDVSYNYLYPQTRMADPEIAGSSTDFQRVAKAAADIQETVTTYLEYKDVEQQHKEARQMLRESDGEPMLGVFLQPENKLAASPLKALRGTAHAQC